MSATLMRHQEEAVAFLLDHGSGLLALEQGLGKSLVAIEAFRRLRSETPAMQLIVICPNSLKRNWAGELAKFAPELTWTIIAGPSRIRRTMLDGVDTDVVILNYELARAEVLPVKAILGRRPCVLVLDEAHSVKTFRSLTSIAARHFAPLTEHRWLLTGTPVTNRPIDLYAQIGLVADSHRHPFGSYESFSDQYDRPTVTPTDRQTLAAGILPYVLRRTKEECLELPEKLFVDIAVELPPWQRRLYDSMRDRLVCEVETMSDVQFACFAPSALAQLLRLSQLASNPALIFPQEARDPGKLVELDRLVDELVTTGGRKIIIWSSYVGSIEAITSRYVHLGAVSLYGATPTAERQAVAAAFQSDPAVRILVANPAAAGTGFTLTAASFAIYETLTWRYDHYAQSQDRNHRIGQTVPVTYIRLLAADTIEEVIAASVARKGEQAAAILGDSVTTAEVAALSRSGFCELLRTSRWPSPTA